MKKEYKEYDEEKIVRKKDNNSHKGVYITIICLLSLIVIGLFIWVLVSGKASLKTDSNNDD